MGRAPWSDLPEELLVAIAKRLDTDIDVLRFCSVCTSWRSSVSPQCNKSSSLRLPLQLPVWFSPHDFNSRNVPGFFILNERTVYRLEEGNDALQSSTAQEPTSVAWLVKVQEAKPGKLRLLNLLWNCFCSPPETLLKVLNIWNLRISVIGKAYHIQYVNPKNRSIYLCGSYYSLHVNKVVLSSNLACEDYAIMAIHGAGKLAFLRAGDEKWKALDDLWTRYEDVVNYKDQFCVVDYTGKALAFDFNFKASEIAASLSSGGGQKKHLVESFGDLLLVDRYLTDMLDWDTGPRTYVVRFKVYKLNKEMHRWDEIKSLGEVALFLGDDCSFSVSARDFSGLKGNCIFYREESYVKRNGNVDALRGYLCGDTGVFNLEDGTLSPLQSYPELCSIFWPPPNSVTC